MPALNVLIRSIHSLIENHIVDLPDVSQEKKKEIAGKVAGFIKDLVVEAVSESVAKSVQNQINK